MGIKLRTERTVIYLHPAAAPKPAIGAACNGCCVCCAIETCPVARVFLLQVRGPCRALQWKAVGQRYVCGMMENPKDHIRLLPKRWEPWFRRRVRRWIAAGIGCDSNVEAGTPPER
ncbi:hypothetical protein BH11PSE11_BH11PSE11_17960 [soil metagenome]